MATYIKTHLYDAIEADPVGGEGSLLCSFDIDGIEGRFLIDCGFGFAEEVKVDHLDKVSSLFVRVDGNNPVVRDLVLPEDVKKTDSSAL